MFERSSFREDELKMPNKMKILNRVFLPMILGAAVSTSCVSTYTGNSISRIGQLNPSGATYVAIPPDGHFESRLYYGSGMKTAQAVNQALAARTKRTEVAATVRPAEESLTAARAGGFDYLITPTILCWVDRATEWSGMLDTMGVEIRTVRVADGETIALGRVTGKSKWMTLSDDAPEQLLAEPIGIYVDWLFSPVGTPLPLREEVPSAQYANEED